MLSALHLEKAPSEHSLLGTDQSQQPDNVPNGKSDSFLSKLHIGKSSTKDAEFAQELLSLDLHASEKPQPKRSDSFLDHFKRRNSSSEESPDEAQSRGFFSKFKSGNSFSKDSPSSEKPNHDFLSRFRTRKSSTDESPEDKPNFLERFKNRNSSQDLDEEKQSFLGRLRIGKQKSLDSPEEKQNFLSRFKTRKSSQDSDDEKQGFLNRLRKVKPEVNDKCDADESADDKHDILSTFRHGKQSMDGNNDDNINIFKQMKPNILPIDSELPNVLSKSCKDKESSDNCGDGESLFSNPFKIGKSKPVVDSDEYTIEPKVNTPNGTFSTVTGTKSSPKDIPFPEKLAEDLQTKLVNPHHTENRPLDLVTGPFNNVRSMNLFSNLNIGKPSPDHEMPPRKQSGDFFSRFHFGKSNDDIATETSQTRVIHIHHHPGTEYPSGVTDNMFRKFRKRSNSFDSSLIQDQLGPGLKKCNSLPDEGEGGFFDRLKSKIFTDKHQNDDIDFEDEIFIMDENNKPVNGHVVPKINTTNSDRSFFPDLKQKLQRKIDKGHRPSRSMDSTYTTDSGISIFESEVVPDENGFFDKLKSRLFSDKHKEGIEEIHVLDPCPVVEYLDGMDPHCTVESDDEYCIVENNPGITMEDKIKEAGDSINTKINSTKQKIHDITGKSSYGPPNVPDTPSKTINDMLNQRCGKTFESPVKAALAFYICYVFQAINMLYNIIHKDKYRQSHTMWMVACGVVSVGLILKTSIVYNIIIASSFLLYAVLYYATIGVCLFGAGLGVAGAVFFDKELKGFDRKK